MDVQLFMKIAEDIGADLSSLLVVEGSDYTIDYSKRWILGNGVDYYNLFAMIVSGKGDAKDAIMLGCRNSTLEIRTNNTVHIIGDEFVKHKGDRMNYLCECGPVYPSLRELLERVESSHLIMYELLGDVVEPIYERVSAYLIQLMTRHIKRAD